MPLSVILASAVLTVPPAAAPVNPVTPAAQAVYQVDAIRREGRSQVLVLGTAHLSSLPNDFDRKRFDPLLDRLARWQPHLIAVESVSGAQCDYLRQFAAFYPDTAKQYCPDPEPARKALGIDQAEAERRIAAILSEPRATRSASQRRALALLFLAAGDPTSAKVQWHRLPVAERKPDGGLNADIAQRLNTSRTNENEIIAVALAVRLGLERVYPVDDHTGDRAAGIADDAFGTALAAAWGNGEWGPAGKAANDAAQHKFLAGGSVIDWYGTINSPAYQRLNTAADFAAAAGDKSPIAAGRRYLAYWEARNLRMVANIREAIGPTPGIRALAIVGASHKSYYERYLGVTSDVQLIDVEAVLR